MKKLILLFLIVPALSYAQWTSEWIAGGGGSTTLNGLTDVDTSGIATNKIPKWNASTNKWEMADDASAAGGGDSTLTSVSVDTIRNLTNAASTNIIVTDTLNVSVITGKAQGNVAWADTSNELATDADVNGRLAWSDTTNELATDANLNLYVLLTAVDDSILGRNDSTYTSIDIDTLNNLNNAAATNIIVNDTLVVAVIVGKTSGNLVWSDTTGQLATDADINGRLAWADTSNELATDADLNSYALLTVIRDTVVQVFADSSVSKLGDNIDLASEVTGTLPAASVGAGLNSLQVDSVGGNGIVTNTTLLDSLNAHAIGISFKNNKFLVAVGTDSIKDTDDLVIATAAQGDTVTGYDPNNSGVPTKFVLPALGGGSADSTYTSIDIDTLNNLTNAAATNIIINDTLVVGYIVGNIGDSDSLGQVAAAEYLTWSDTSAQIATLADVNGRLAWADTSNELATDANLNLYVLLSAVDDSILGRNDSTYTSIDIDTLNNLTNAASTNIIVNDTLVVSVITGKTSGNLVWSDTTGQLATDADINGRLAWADTSNELATDANLNSYLLLSAILDTLNNYDGDVAFTQGNTTIANGAVTKTKLGFWVWEKNVIFPDTLLSAGPDTVWIGKNHFGTTITIDSTYLEADTDNYPMSVVKSNIDGSSVTVVDSVTAINNGSNHYYVTDASVTSGSITAGQRLGLILTSNNADQAYIAIYASW